MKPFGLSGRVAWTPLARLPVALIGSYLLTSLATIVASLILVRAGVDKVAAVIVPTLAGFVVFAVLVLTLFHTRTPMRACAWIATASFLLAGSAWLLIRMGFP